VDRGRVHLHRPSCAASEIANASARGGPGVLEASSRHRLQRPGARVAWAGRVHAHFSGIKDVPPVATAGLSAANGSLGSAAR